MRIAVVNVVWDAGAGTAAATLDRFTTLTGWADAVASSDSANTVAVFQRFHADAEVARGLVAYRFVADGGLPKPPAWFRGTRRLIQAITDFRPGVVHVNGLDHPLFIRRLRRALSPGCAIVVQDHGGFDPYALPRLRKAWMRHGLSAASGLLVATPPQADVFRASGLVPPALPVHDVMEGSTALRAHPGRERRRPLALLWVGRLNANKDPLTVLAGFAQFVAAGADASLTMVYGSAELEPAVRAAIEFGPHAALLKSRVALAGFVPHDAIDLYYEAADIFVQGSRREGSGYAALEALACGVVPVLTDIPSFRWLTDDGRVGALWRAGDPASLAGALANVASQPITGKRTAARELFDRRFSWDAIGRRATAIYRERCRT